MEDPHAAGNAIRALTNLGIKFSIDDFGTGYSSFGQLTQLPFSQIKVDRSFVLQMQASSGDAVIVQSIVDLGHNLHLEVVAEGIEDAATLDALKRLGCDAAQGYHLCAPAPAPRAEEWIRASCPPAASVTEPSNVVLLAEAR
jgi:EAL domain-containing protein (putative c-di-GMP-specific phosphodiesterase class I)